MTHWILYQSLAESINDRTRGLFAAYPLNGAYDIIYNSSQNLLLFPNGIDVYYFVDKLNDNCFVFI